jgi:hypothetical protein
MKMNLIVTSIRPATTSERFGGTDTRRPKRDCLPVRMPKPDNSISQQFAAILGLAAYGCSVDCDRRRLRALREGGWPSVVLLNSTIDARAQSIQEHMNEMKRRNQRRRDGEVPVPSEREVP